MSQRARRRSPRRIPSEDFYTGELARRRYDLLVEGITPEQAYWDMVDSKENGEKGE